jgi:cyclopropane-fatty-acyl-phospholipid synthase
MAQSSVACAAVEGEMDWFLRSFLSTLIKTGALEVVTPSGHHLAVGDGSAAIAEVSFRDEGAVRAFLRNPGLKFGELYMDGRVAITRGTLYDVIALAIRNVQQFQHFPWLRAVDRLRYLARPFSRNRRNKARSNVAHHYDLDGRLYRLFLDQDQQYSCAYFEHEGVGLDEAQLAKKRHIAAKLLTEPGNRILDIGCGWGGMALYLAEFCGADVTGVTLSQEQLAVARQRAVDSGQQAKTEFRLQDYRDIGSSFDRIVSVGMFEHVGLGSYDAFFQQIARLLNDDGVALLHTIGHTGEPSPTNEWVDKYIFPGGYIPSLSDIMPAIQRAGLMVTDIEVLRLHYAETLRQWRERFQAHRQEAAEFYDERFCRMWEFYLAGSECTFRYEGTVNFQIQLAKQVGTVPLTRDYIATREAELRRRDTAVPSLRIAG